MLEFLPGFVSILLAGNMDVPDTQHYVDAATISIMVSAFLGVSMAKLKLTNIVLFRQFSF